MVPEKPTGRLEIVNIFGKKVASLKVNDPPHNILPDQTRRFEQTLNKKWLFGRYRAKATLAYGNKQVLASPTLVFWVIPYKLVILAVLLLVVLILALKRLIGGYNRRIIARSKRQ